MKGCVILLLFFCQNQTAETSFSFPKFLETGKNEIKFQKNRQTVPSFQAFLVIKQIQSTVQYRISSLLEKFNNLLEKFVSN